VLLVPALVVARAIRRPFRLSRGPMPEPDTHNVPRPGPTPTVLLVEDEPTSRAEAARLLRGGLKSCPRLTLPLAVPVRSLSTWLRKARWWGQGVSEISSIHQTDERRRLNLNRLASMQEGDTVSATATRRRLPRQRMRYRSACSSS